MTKALVAQKSLITSRFADGGAVVVHLGQNKYFEMNSSARVLWDAVSEGADEAGCVAALLSKFRVDEAQAACSSKAFLATALSLGIVVEKE